MEYGLGAHGEPGATKTEVHDLDTVVRTVVERVGCVGEYEDDQKVQPGSEVVVLINNMGGLTLLEQGAVAGSVRRQVEEVLGCTVVRLFVGPFLTSLDMKGFSVSLLRLGDRVDEILRLLDAPTDAMAWPGQRRLGAAVETVVETVVVVQVDGWRQRRRRAKGAAAVHPCGHRKGGKRRD
jgi:dihydroxyacetone kinase